MWSDQIVDSNFRGVPFQEPERVRSGGRRGPTHEFPQRELPDAEDTGRKVRVFKVTAFVHGDDYYQKRDALLEALEKPGAGLYVDPWQGQWQVIARSYSCSERKEEGGIARFSITFEEAGEERFPKASANTRVLVSEAAGVLTDAVVADFSEAFSLEGLPQFVSDASTEVAQQYASGLMSKLQKIPGANLTLAQDFKSNASALVRGDFGAASQDLIEGIAGGLYSDRSRLPGDPLAAASLFAGLGDFGPDLPSVQTPTVTRERQASNQNAMTELFGGLALSAEAAATARVTFESSDAATAHRGAIGARFDTAMMAAGNSGRDTVFGSLSILRSAVMSDLLVRSDRLPRLGRLVPKVSEPAVVLAHRIWGDARRADELVARNPHITHGGFVPSGQSLEVLGA